MKNAIAILAETPPPGRRPWKFQDVRAAAKKITQLESALSLQPGPKIYNLREANRRAAELESLLAAKTASPVASPVVMPPAAEKFGRARFNAACSAELSRSPEKTHAHLTGRGRWAAADHRVSSQPAAPALAPVEVSQKEKLTGRARFNAAIKEDLKGFTTNQKP